MPRPGRPDANRVADNIA
ncbi:predicted protein [Fibroporia radiculosa]|uniref:Uncharacterized protein n=1 Tax=Fibroporia radiculosa TaxID=599839 RepID=J4H4W0_9APHY|nr:predicted protein [Fibroporia radiculosa]